jgi:hypothetical protein
MMEISRQSKCFAESCSSRFRRSSTAVPTLATGPGAHHAGRRLHEPAGRGVRMSNDTSNTATHTSETPQLLP